MQQSVKARLAWFAHAHDTPDEAEKRFGELMHASTRTYREFENPGEGIWRPIYSDGELVSYGLYKLRRITKSLSWRRSRRR